MPVTLSQEAFEREISTCRRLYQERGGCAWGRCDTCGVIPLLYKLHHGVVVEKEEDIQRVKNEVFGR